MIVATAYPVRVMYLSIALPCLLLSSWRPVGVDGFSNLHHPHPFASHRGGKTLLYRRQFPSSAVRMLHSNSSSAESSDYYGGDKSLTNLNELRSSLESLLEKATFVTDDGIMGDFVEVEEEFEVEEEEEEAVSRQAEALSPFEELEREEFTSPAREKSDRQERWASKLRNLRQHELKLLQSLMDSDAAIDDLVLLWTTEANAAAAADILSLQKTCSAGLVNEEKLLCDLCRQFPSWAEPFARLATLLYFQDRPDEAERMAREALRRKPWHFEVLQLLVMLALGRDDFGMALHWARKSLPTLRTKLSHKTNRRRKYWVRRAMAMAVEEWNFAEKASAAARQQAHVEAWFQRSPTTTATTAEAATSTATTQAAADVKKKKTKVVKTTRKIPSHTAQASAWQ